MLTEGKILHRAIKLSPYKIEQIIEITGISRGKLYDMFKLELIDDDDKELLKKLKLDLNFSTKNTETENIEDAGYKKKYVELLEKRNFELEEQIKNLDIRIKQSAYNKATLITAIEKLTNQIESLNGLEHLVREALETGALKKK